MADDSSIRYPWQLDVLVELSPDKAEGYHVPAGTKVALEGSLEAAAYLYVAQVEDGTKFVSVLYPPSGDPPVTPAAARVRCPPEGYAVTTARGFVRAVGAPGPLTRAQIAELCGGREPPPGTSTTKNL
jgi:hypothetical protein